MNGKQWSPFTRLVWLVLLFGVPVEIWGWLPVLIFAVVNVAVALTLGAVAVSRSRQGAARENEELDRVMASWRDA